MVVIDNLAHILSGLVDSKERACFEWRLLGEEYNRLTVSWVSKNVNNDEITTNIASFLSNLTKVHVLKRLHGRVNVIQAAIDTAFNYLSYSVRNTNGCTHFLHDLNSDSFLVTLQDKKQIMSAFLHSNQSTKLLVFVHLENIFLHEVGQNDKLLRIIRTDILTASFTWAQWDFLNQVLYFIHFRKNGRANDGDEEDKKNNSSPILSAFQFHSDLPHETVMNIPLNLPSLPTTEEELLYEDDCVPLRVHDCSLDLIVVTHSSGQICICHHYLYQPVKPPLKDGISHKVTADSVHFAYSITVLHHGCVLHCIVPGVPWKRARTLRPVFAMLGSQYLLVHGPHVFTHLLDIGSCHEPVCHIVLTPSIEEEYEVEQETIRYAPLSISMYEDGSKNDLSSRFQSSMMIDLTTLNLNKFEISFQQLFKAFVEVKSDMNRVAIMHYFLLHDPDWDKVRQLLELTNCSGILSDIRSTLRLLLQEILVGGTYILTRTSIPQTENVSDVHCFLNLLPLTCCNASGQLEVKVGVMSMSLSMEILWNTAMMLLSPQQRIVSSYRADLWTKLWNHLAGCTETPRFKHSLVADKLVVSLFCYQPEALSRCTTPMSPSGPTGVNAALLYPTSGNLIGLDANSRRVTSSTSIDYVKYLPFHEVEVVTASRQEHVIAVNLREITMYLLRGNTKRGAAISSQITISHGPLLVHAIATRYVTAQLEVSRLLCGLLAHLALNADRNYGIMGFDLMYEHKRYAKNMLQMECDEKLSRVVERILNRVERTLIRENKLLSVRRTVDDEDENMKQLLFSLYLRYFHAVDLLAFPLPQGFCSFFAFLGFHVLPFSSFLDYVQCGVLELHVDAMKEILKDIDDDSDECVRRKLRLLQLLPRSRAKRLLNTWNHPLALMIRAREHALNVLSGNMINSSSSSSKKSTVYSHSRTRPLHASSKGLTAFPSGDRVSPLDTFLDLLTAKASLPDLDFNLLIEATVSSTIDFTD